MVHHGNEKVEKDDDVDHRKASKHDEAPESCKLFDSIQFKIIQVYQTKGGPEKGLSSLPKTGYSQELFLNIQILITIYLANFLYARQWFISITISLLTSYAI